MIPLEHCRLLPLAAMVFTLACSPVSAQSITADDPLAAAQARAAERAASAPNISGIGAGAAKSISDPIVAAQVLAAAEKTFPNLAEDLEHADLLRRATTDPILRGNLRGRIAESDWINRNAGDGWKAVKKPNAPQNDAYRFVNGKLEGAQIKVHADWHDYIRSMAKDNKAERFVVPDDQYDRVYQEWETRRIGAARGGLVEKSAECARQQLRLTKMGRSFSEIDGAVGAAAKHYERIATAIRVTGKAASFVAIAMSILDGGMAVYEVAIGKSEVDELIAKVGKIAVGGTASWALGGAAGSAAIAAGATGAVPVAVVIVVGTATYLVVDWAIDSLSKTVKAGRLNADDVKRVWPTGARGVSLESLYRKPKDPAILLK